VLDARAGRSITVATYNIHRCVGRGRHPDPRRTLDVIAALDADLIALQEVETPAAPSSGALALLRRLRELGYELVLGPTMRSHRHSYGNVLLSRLPVRRRRRIDLSQSGREPRGLIDVRLDLGRATRAQLAPMLARIMGRVRQANESGERARRSSLPALGRSVELRCLATHLGLRVGERQAQIAQLAERLDLAGGEAAAHIGQSRDGAGQRPLVLLGDFNEWRVGSGRLQPIHARLEAAPARGTWPSRWPLLALDRIWYRGGLHLTDLEVVRTPLARAASDHLPLRARLWLPAV